MTPVPPVPAPRPSVLLVAGDVRDAWKVALEEAGFRVRTAGWLDAVTSARIERPDLLLVAADLPAGAPLTLTTTFRAGALRNVPVAIAGWPAEVVAREREQPLAADRYVLAPVTPEALARGVAEAIRAGRVPWRRPRAQKVAAALAALAGLLVAVPALWGGFGHLAGKPDLSPVAQVAFLAGALAALGAAVAVGLSTRKRATTLRERRSGVGWLAVVAAQLPGAVRIPVVKVALLSVAALALAEWARLGFRAVPPPTRGRRRWYTFLAALGVAVAIAPWVVWALFGGPSAGP